MGKEEKLRAKKDSSMKKKMEKILQRGARRETDHEANKNKNRERWRGKGVEW